MLRYIIKRLMLMIPTLVVVSLLAFLLNANAPGDPVLKFIGEEPTMNASPEQRSQYQKLRNDYHQKLGLHLPIFYCSVHALSEETSFLNVSDPLQQKTLKRLLEKCGSEELVRSYYKNLIDFETQLYAFKTENDSIYEVVAESKALFSGLYFAYEFEEIRFVLDGLSSALLPLKFSVHELKDAFEAVQNSDKKWRNYIPTISFHFPNRYHHWIFGDGIQSHGIIRGDFGRSYQDSRKVTDLLVDRLPATLLLSFIAIFLSYMLSIPFGILSAQFPQSFPIKFLSSILYILYSLPSFWVASLLIIYFAGGDYFDWFPTYGLAGDDETLDPSGNLLNKIHHLILPVFCWTYGGLAYLSKQTSISMMTEGRKDYVKTAMAKGLPMGKVYRKHIFANSLLPLITLFGNVFPALIGGAVVLEVIFNIPGMGELSYQAYHQKDYPVILAVLTFGTFLTLLGYLISDILYAFADPRIRYESKDIQHD